MNKRFVMGLFPEEHCAVAAVKALAASPWPVVRVHSPIPSQALAGALNLAKSRVGYFTLTGGIVGFFFGLALAVFTATRWHLIVSGKPVVALVPFFIVGFEFTILFAVFGNVVGMLTQSRLPAWKAAARFYDERCSGAHFGVLASCPEAEMEDLMALLKTHGGEIRRYDT